tara:strand:+ start:1440 stop:1889 length:450 start_codon:yes stop_codon:yes gene_type:complete
MPIKTFRGQLGDGDQQVINLHTNNGSTGYRITKFQLMCVQPGSTNQENVVKIYKISQTTVPTSGATIDFSDNTLLAAGIFSASANQKTDPEDLAIIFDSEVFNQDIYITNTDNENAVSINYYIELEQVKLDMNENTVATLKDIRNVTGG